MASAAMMSVVVAVAMVADSAVTCTASPTCASRLPSTWRPRVSDEAVMPSGTVSSSSWTPTVAPRTVCTSRLSPMLTFVSSVTMTAASAPAATSSRPAALTVMSPPSTTSMSSTAAALTEPSACSSNSAVASPMRSLAERDMSFAIICTELADAWIAESERRSSSPVVMPTSPPTVKSIVRPAETSRSADVMRSSSEATETELVDTTSTASAEILALSVARTTTSDVRTSTASPARTRSRSSASAVMLPPRTLRRSEAKASSERPASRETRAAETSTFSRASTCRLSATSEATCAMEPVTWP